MNGIGSLQFYAGLALAGMLANPESWKEATYTDMVKDAFMVARMMIEEENGRLWGRKEEE